VPEGDTIRRLSARLDEAFAGATVQRSTFRHPRLATLDLAGRTLLGTGSTGKHLFLRFDDGRSLAIHLLLQGSVVLGRSPVEAWRRRFELDFARPPGGRCTGVDIPKLELLRTADEAAFVDHLGPDACGAYDHAAAVASLCGAGDLPLGAALLDQRVVAGLGNIYAVEAPFICGVDPRTPVGALADPAPVLAVAVALIRTNAWLGPQNTTGRRLERSDHWVLAGRIRHCRRCGTDLVRLAEHETPWRRRTAVCPACQVARVVDPERVRALLSLHPARRLLDLDAVALTPDTSAPVQPRPAPPRRRQP